MVLEVGEEQPLKHLSSRAKKRDRSVGCAGVSGFTGFRDGGNGGSLPDGRNVGSSHRKIEESAQIGDALRAQVSKMEDCEPVRTRSGGRARNPNGIAEEFRCERSEAGIYGVAGAQVALDSSGLPISGYGAGGELLAESESYSFL